MKRFLVRARRGTSLIEILVAMVILLVGIYSLVQLFPSGFSLIIYGRNVTQAHALASGMLEDWRVRHDTLPDAVIALNPVTLNPELPPSEELLPFRQLPVGRRTLASLTSTRCATNWVRLRRSPRRRLALLTCRPTARLDNGFPFRYTS